MDNRINTIASKTLGIVLMCMLFVLLFFVKDTFADEEIVDESVIVDETASEENAIPKYMMNGVVVNGVSVGGMTFEEAEKIINDKWNAENTDKMVTINIDGNLVAATTSELGYSWNRDTVDEALSLGNRGSVLKRYKDVKDVNTVGKSYDLSVDVNDEIMTNTINERCGVFNTPHKNAKLTRVNGGFDISKEENGRIIDMEDAVSRIHTYLLEEWDKISDFEISLKLIEDYPTATVADCERVKDLLGTFSTTFSTGSSNYNRNKNMENGVRLLDGITLYKDEVLSVNSYLEPWTSDNGWYEAGTYVNGKVENSLGGGICQVSTTFYNAVLKAELEIVERYPHSMSVGYVPLSQDAALAGTYKDLKIKNNTDAPVYVEAIYSSGRITFNIYGEETRPSNRTIEYISETLDTIPSTEAITEDPTKPVDYREVTESGHTGYRARLMKRVYVDGVLVSEEVENTSNYASSPTKVTVGTGQAVEQPTPDPNVNPQPETKPTEKPTEKPTVSSGDAGGQGEGTGDTKPDGDSGNEKPEGGDSGQGGEGENPDEPSGGDVEKPNDGDNASGEN